MNSSELEAKLKANTTGTGRHYIDVADVAKIVRVKLAENFPGVKFSVHSSRYSGGSSITVRWMDGPTEKRVERVCGKYHGADFDGMIDLKSYNGSAYANDFIFFERDYSLALVQRAVKRTIKKWGIDFAPEYEVTSCGTAYLANGDEFFGNDRIKTYVWREMQEMGA